MGKSQPLRILFGGDFAPHGAYETLIAKGGSNVFGNALEAIETADYTIINLELPVCRETVSVSKIGPALRASPDVLRAVADVGVDAVCLANNHIYDFGNAGLSQTLEALTSFGIGHVGAGLDRSTAERALRIEKGARSVSIFAFAEQEFNLSDDGAAGAAILDPMRMARLLLDERKNSDAIIVCIHGGNEYFSYPRPGLRRICQFLVDIGADAVVGHHPHVPGPYEIYRGKPIVYSLGNLIFDVADPPPGWDEGYFACIELTFNSNGMPTVELDLIPYTQSVELGGIELMEGAERSQFISRIEDMRDHLENRPDQWREAWREFVAAKELQAMIDLSSPIRFRGFRRLLALFGLKRFIVPRSFRQRRLNLLRCESHREVIISALEHR